MQVHRPIVVSRKGLVVAGHHMAAEAGVRILQQGGNAMDAAVAAAATLAVAIPHMNGLGGDAFALWFDRTKAQVFCINGSGGAPNKATLAHYQSLALDEVPQRGPLSISVPGAVHSWGTALERFGTIPLGAALSPAIELAETGTPVDRNLLDFFNGPIYADLCKQFPSLITVFSPPGLRPLASVLRQPVLANTLREIAKSGITCLYGGEVGRALVADVARVGALLSVEDLANHETEIQMPLSIPFRGTRVYAAPPNSQGLALLLLLGMLSFAQGECDGYPRDFFLRFMAIKHLAFKLRDQIVGEPRISQIPETLLAPESLKNLVQSAQNNDSNLPADAQVWRRGGGDTTCVVTMDEAGNAVSWVQSLFDEFGSGIVSESTGIVLHNRLHLASLKKGRPNTLEPNHRPFHTLCPALVIGDGRCYLAIATPGDHGQPQTLAQVILNIWARKMDIQQAIEAPRIRHESGLEIFYEDRLERDFLAPLKESGYKVRTVGPWSRLMGGVNAIYFPPKTLKMGGADPRRASYAVAQ